VRAEVARGRRRRRGSSAVPGLSSRPRTASAPGGAWCSGWSGAGWPRLGRSTPPAASRGSARLTQVNVTGHVYNQTNRQILVLFV